MAGTGIIHKESSKPRGKLNSSKPDDKGADWRSSAYLIRHVRANLTPCHYIANLRNSHHFNKKRLIKIMLNAYRGSRLDLWNVQVWLKISQGHRNLSGARLGAYTSILNRNPIIGLPHVVELFHPVTELQGSKQGRMFELYTYNWVIFGSSLAEP